MPPLLPFLLTRARGAGSFTETELGEIKFPDISAPVLEKVCQYFYYKLKYMNRCAALRQRDPPRRSRPSRGARQTGGRLTGAAPPLQRRGTPGGVRGQAGHGPGIAYGLKLPRHVSRGPAPHAGSTPVHHA